MWMRLNRNVRMTICVVGGYTFAKALQFAIGGWSAVTLP